jgi:hypothetical protein
VYRHCIYCSSELGANEALEGFPVGSSLAFDAGKGRLWAVCPRCSRWNLAPIEERWEVVESAEKRFRDTRLRVQNENVGIAKLPDGTRLIRVGEALPGEIAAWRYGEGLVARRRRYLVGTGVMSLSGLGFLGFKLATVGAFGIISVAVMFGGRWLVRQMADEDEAPVIHRFRRGSLPYADDFTLTSRHLDGTRLVPAGHGGFDLRVPHQRTTLGKDDDGRARWVRFSGFMLCGEDARNALGRTMAVLNLSGGSRRTVREALGALSEAGDASSFLRRQAEREARVEGEGGSRVERRVHRLALEMALHDEQERRAMEGELSMLEAAWKEAEAIAGIADRLAGAVEPPKHTA